MTVTADGRIYLQETQVELDKLSARLLAIAEGGYDERVYVRGDKAAVYGEVMQVMATLNTAGFRKIGLVNDPAVSGGR